MQYKNLLTSLEDQILIITINRAEKLNALNAEVMSELQIVTDEIYQNPQIRSAIITGSGNKAFVAGADISEFKGLSRQEAESLARKGQELFFKIENAPKPIVAAVNGFALGGGFELALACHFRLCSNLAKFGQPEVNLGLIPGYGGTQRLTILAGKGRAMEMMMSAGMISAEQALAYGIVNYVTSPEDLLAKCRNILASIIGKAPIAISKVIECVNMAVKDPLQGFAKEVAAFGECFATEDMEEGIRAFMEKRKPVFKGK
jgi:enoyl-CoA hydratase